MHNVYAICKHLVCRDSGRFVCWYFHIAKTMFVFFLGRTLGTPWYRDTQKPNWLVTMLQFLHIIICFGWKFQSHYRELWYLRNKMRKWENGAYGTIYIICVYSMRTMFIKFRYQTEWSTKIHLFIEFQRKKKMKEFFLFIIIVFAWQQQRKSIKITF